MKTSTTRNVSLPRDAQSASKPAMAAKATSPMQSRNHFPLQDLRCLEPSISNTKSVAWLFRILATNCTEIRVHHPTARSLKSLVTKFNSIDVVVSGHVGQDDLVALIQSAQNFDGI